MGLFSKIFGHKNSAPLPVEEPEEQPIGGLYKGMQLAVMDMERSVFASGTLYDYTAHEFTILPQSNGERLPIWEPGTALNIRGYRRNMSPVDISACSGESSEVKLQVLEPKVIEHVEKRSTFRVPVHVPGELFENADTQHTWAESCTVVDISSEGALVETDIEHELGETLYLRVQLNRNTPQQIFQCIVARISTERRELPAYGLRFWRLDEKGREVLMNSIFDVQRETRRKMTEQEFR